MIKDTLKGILALALIFAVLFGIVKIWSWAGNEIAENKIENEVARQELLAREVTNQEVIDMAKACGDVGLTLVYDYKFVRSVGSIPIRVRCGKSIEQLEVEKPTDGESIGGAVVGTAAVVGGAYLLGKMME